LLAVVLANGDLNPPKDMPARLAAAGLVVAADGGSRHCRTLDLLPDIVVGDLDSLDSEARAELEAQGVQFVSHPADKDQTDLDLAFDLALTEDPGRVVVVGGTGGRFDHEISTSGLLCADRWEDIDEIDWVSPRGWAHVVRRRRILHADVGATISLIPVGGWAIGVATSGLEWELRGEDLDPGSTRGVSNVMRAPFAEVRLESGCLLAVFPI
jgi:thiamine pyrophosphokinase